jgi:membrane-associated phospholipid phosphatase
VFRRNAAVLACAFAALAVLVAGGAVTDVDQWAVEHLMPGGRFHHPKNGLLDGLVPLLHSRWESPYGIAANVVTLPASLIVSAAIAFACSRLLGIALVAAVAVEVVCKEVLTRPSLYHGSFHIAAFDSSFPSGHSLRTVIVAAAVAWSWPRVRLIALAWAIASLVLIQLAGWHTPTDIAGGVILAALALLGARTAGALGRRRLAARPRAGAR